MTGARCRLGRPPALSGAERTCRILAAAEAEFVRHGYSGATMERIAAGAGMSKRTLYRHFPDKLAVLSALLRAYDADPVMERLADPDPPGTPREILHPSLCEIAGFILGPGQIALSRLAIAEATTAPEVARLFYDNAIGNLSAAFARRLARLAATGAIRATDPERLGELLVGATLNRQVFRRLTHADEPRPLPAQIAARVDAVIALVAPGLGLPD